MQCIIVIGLPGAGKSSVLREISNTCLGVSVVNYGDAMVKSAKIDRDQLRKMPMEKQQEIGLKAAEQIASKAKGITIIDTHALIKTTSGFCPGLPQVVLEKLNPKAIALIECPSRMILERRKEDTSRTRDLQAESELTLHREFNRSFVTACSVLTGCAICPIDNTGPNLSNNVQPLIRLIRSL